MVEVLAACAHRDREEARGDLQPFGVRGDETELADRVDALALTRQVMTSVAGVMDGPMPMPTGSMPGRFERCPPSTETMRAISARPTAASAIPTVMVEWESMRAASLGARPEVVIMAMGISASVESMSSR